MHIKFLKIPLYFGIKPPLANTSGVETGIFRDHQVSFTAADALGPCVVSNPVTDYVE